MSRLEKERGFQIMKLDFHVEWQSSSKLIHFQKVNCFTIPVPTYQL